MNKNGSKLEKWLKKKFFFSEIQKTLILYFQVYVEGLLGILYEIKIATEFQNTPLLRLCFQIEINSWRFSVDSNSSDR
jgi:hypothetical protein